MRFWSVLVAVAVLAAGCSGGGPVAAPTTTPLTGAAPFTLLPGSTPAGTHLAIGQQAVITVGLSSDESRVGIIINRIDRGTPQDLAALRADLPSENVAGQLFFVRATLVDIDGMADASSYTGPQLVGVTASGGDADYLFGNAEVKLPHCTMIPAAPGPWGVKGARRDVCDIQIASAGDPVTGARVDVGNNEPDIIWH